MQHDLGSKYFQKSKTHHYLLAKDWIETEENMIWASMEAIFQLIEKDNFLNADLRSLLSVMDWDKYFNPSLIPNSTQKWKYPKTLPQTEKYQLVSLEELSNWELNQKGILPTSTQATSVHIYQFSCTNREVSSWSQPLFEVNSKGIIQLFVRKTEEETEFLISIGKEVGISTPYAYYPSKMSLPEDNHSPILDTPGQLIRQLIQCDEGGRFFQNDNLYQFILVEDLKEESNQQWITKSQLKYLLQTSNQCSFQLRCAASLALDWLNPRLFN